MKYSSSLTRPVTAETRYTVSVLVNDEVDDPSFREVSSWLVAENLAKGYVVTAEEGGWSLTEHRSPTSWKLVDDDGDRIHILIARSNP